MSRAGFIWLIWILAVVMAYLAIMRLIGYSPDMCRAQGLTDCPRGSSV